MCNILNVMSNTSPTLPFNILILLIFFLSGAIRPLTIIIITAVLQLYYTYTYLAFIFVYFDYICKSVSLFLLFC